MTNRKIKIPAILLVIDIFLIILMHAIGAYLDTFEKCRGFMGAVAPCVEGYFYGYLYFAYTIIPFLIIVTAVNWVDFRKKAGRPACSGQMMNWTLIPILLILTL